MRFATCLQPGYVQGKRLGLGDLDSDGTWADAAILGLGA